jgi:beta-glucosidase
MFGKSLRRDSRTPEVIIAEALEIAKQSDVIVAAVGESSEMSGESSSRADIGIPKAQQDLLKALVTTGKPIVLVLFTGRPLTLTWEHANIPAILNVWFAGSEAGYAIADVLFGEVNPSGKLTTSFPQHVGQVPLFYAQKNTGRPLTGPWFSKFRSNYLDVSNEPLYPFGYGLSYTQFTYGDLQLTKKSLKAGDTLFASVAVTNTGDRYGKETVQLYIRDLVGSVTRPVKELKGFEKIALRAGETKVVNFPITTDDLKFYNYDLNYTWEPGDFEIMIGSSSVDLKKGTVNWAK